jgi:streptogramin lyase
MAVGTIALLAVVSGIAMAEFSQSSPLVGDLGAPRGLSVAANGDLLVAEQATGRVLQVDGAGAITVLVDGVVGVVTGGGPEGTDAAGITAALAVSDGLYFITGEFDADGEAGFQTLYRQAAGGEPEAVADLFAYEQANNTDGETAPVELLSNPYDLVAAPQGGVLVSDAGANAVLHIDGDGAVSPFAIFNQRPNPLGFGPPVMDQVPTGLTIGPDGAVYVSTLTGFPFPADEARVYRLEDLNNDGDALDEGETSTPTGHCW